MSHLSEGTVIQIYDWYADIERRLMEIIRILPFVEHTELRNIRSPRLVPILLEAASLVDVLLRDQLPNEFTRPNGKKCRKKNANILDYKSWLNPLLKLSDSQSLLLLGLPSLLTPFEVWDDQSAPPLVWWNAYNELKHNRLAGTGTATLENCLYAICALNQVMLKHPDIAPLAFRFGWAQIAGYNPQIAIQDIQRPVGLSYVAYTDCFATFTWQPKFNSVDEIRPIMFRNGERLQSHLGRLGNEVESR